MTRYIIGIEKYRRGETGREICEKAEIYRSGIQDLFNAASFDRILYLRGVSINKFLPNEILLYRTIINFKISN